MCGIFGYIGAGNATEIVFDGLKKLEYRGYDSWGIAVMAGQALFTEKHIGKIAASHLTLPPSPCALGHTRWATHGGVTDANAHPHLDCQGKIAVVHNGIIENYQLLKAELQALGHRFTSETDTEVFAHLIEEANKKTSFVKAVKASFARAKGLNTLVALDHTGTLVACRNGSPLVVGKTATGDLFVSSDIPSLLSYTKRLSVVEDSQVVVIQGGTLTTPLKFKTITMDAETADKGIYPHFLLKEIHDQPLALNRLAQADLSAVSSARKILAKATSVYGLGCGTAFFSMLEASYLFAQYSQKQLIPIPANEFAGFAGLLGKDSVVILASQSGETIDTIQAMRLAKSRGAKTIALVNVPGSTLSREVDVVIPLLAGIERAVVSTKAFTNMVASILMILDQPKILKQASALVPKILAGTTKAKILALLPRLMTHEHLFIIGRGTNYPLALEGALKLKETAYFHAEGFAGGELKHGMIALIEPGTPCLVIVSADTEKVSTLSGAMELKARGAWIIGIGPQQEEVFDDWIPVPATPLTSPLLNAIPLQLLGYYLAVAKNLDPDMPRNLAKSVTVK